MGSSPTSTIFLLYSVVQRSWAWSVHGRLCCIRGCVADLWWSSVSRDWRCKCSFTLSCGFAGLVGRISAIWQRGKLQKEASRGFEPRSLDSESRVLTVTPRGQLNATSFFQLNVLVKVRASQPSQICFRDLPTYWLFSGRWEICFVRMCRGSHAQLMDCLLAPAFRVMDDWENTPGQDRTGDLQRVRLTS